MTSSPRDHSFFSAGQAGAQAGSFKSAPRDILLSGIAESRECEVEAPRAEQIQKSPDVCCATNWNDGNTFGVETPTASASAWSASWSLIPSTSTTVRAGDPSAVLGGVIVGWSELPSS